MASVSPVSTGLRASVLARARDWDRTFEPLHVFGGRPLSEAALPVSRVTGRALHLTLDLDVKDPRLGAIDFGSLERFAVIASYHVDASAGPLVVRHHDGGRRLELLAEPVGAPIPGIPDELPQLPVELRPLSEAELALETADEYPEGHPPLHQVGGRSLGITGDVEAPRCPETGEAMQFVASIDSVMRFPLGDSDVALLFGDCGMLYVFWSVAASISTAVVQSD